MTIVTDDVEAKFAQLDALQAELDELDKRAQEVMDQRKAVMWDLRNKHLVSVADIAARVKLHRSTVSEDTRGPATRHYKGSTARRRKGKS